MDDLKVYTKNREEMLRCIDLIKKFSDDIKMDFGIEKCAVLHIEKGKINHSPFESEIPALGPEESYKYLGIAESSDILHDEMKKKAKSEYISRVRAILKSKLNANNTAQALNGYAMPIMRYGFGILKWTKTELAKLDRKIRKLLTENGFHHPKSNIHRLYTNRQDGGRGICSTYDCYEQECSSVAKYLEIAAPEDHLTALVKTLEDSKPPTIAITRFNSPALFTDPKETSKKHAEEYTKMAMHGQWRRDRDKIVTIDTAKSDQWLKQSGIHSETESLICAAQEQSLATNYVRNKIWKQNVTSKCRLCKVKEETVSHLVSECTMLAGTKYSNRHDRIGTYLHWCILKELNEYVCDDWYKHVPKSSVECGDITVMWDFTLITDKKIPANRPDITIHDRKNRKATLIDVSVPIDNNIVRKTAEKHVKYRDLEIEIQKCWGLKEIKTVPIVIGALGSVLTGHAEYLKSVSEIANFNVIQKTALLGTANILRSVLGTKSINK